jgi:subtilase family serine protease
MTKHVRGVINGQAPSAGRLPAGQSMRLVIVLPLGNALALDQFLKELYNPASPSYRRYLSVDEFTTRFGPTEHDYDAVLRWA